MNGKKKTKAQVRRYQIITQELGCECCHIEIGEYVPCQIHHIDNIGKTDNDRVIGLCPWHHSQEGKPLRLEERGYTHHFQPWLKQRDDFTERYGTQQELEKRMNERIRVFESGVIGGRK